MKHFESDKNSLKILRIVVSLLTLLLSALSVYFLSFIPIVMFSLCGVFLLIGTFLVFFFLPVYFRNLNYYIYDGKIIKESGFYFRKRQIISIDKIQFTSVVSTPFSKFMGLNFIGLYAYGGIMTVMFLTDGDFTEFTSGLRI